MYSILVDVTRCTGCDRCASACVEANHLDRLRAETDRTTSPEGLSADRWTSVIKVADGRFAKKSCMHCEDPSCVAACLVGGITKSPDGPVIYDPDKCIGCRYCMLACPFHIPRYEWDKTIPFMRKCNMCAERLKDGKLPACVEACPNDALRFGDRETLLHEAHRRIADDPRYKPHVWGESEFGGTSVLYIADVDLADLGWPARAETPIPFLTEPLISKTPFIGLGVAISTLGLNWIIRRRMQLSEERAASPKNLSGSDEGGVDHA